MILGSGLAEALFWAPEIGLGFTERCSLDPMGYWFGSISYDQAHVQLKNSDIITRVLKFHIEDRFNNAIEFPKPLSLHL